MKACIDSTPKPPIRFLAFPPLWGCTTLFHILRIRSGTVQKFFKLAAFRSFLLSGCPLPVLSRICDSCGPFYSSCTILARLLIISPSPFVLILQDSLSILLSRAFPLINFSLRTRSCLTFLSPRLELMNPLPRLPNSFVKFI